MLLKEINPAIFKNFGKPLRNLNGIKGYSCIDVEEDAKVRSNLWHFEEESVLVPVKGVGLLFVRLPDSIIQRFLFDQPVLLNPGVEFAILPYGGKLQYKIFHTSPRFISPTTNLLTNQGFVPKISIKTLYSVLYQEKDRQFAFRGEEHPFWELTYVNMGTMICEIDGIPKSVGQGQMIFFAPHQFHVQRSDGKSPLAFLTVTFDGSMADVGTLTNRVINCDESALAIVRSIIQEEREGLLYGDDMISFELGRLIVATIRRSLSAVSEPRIPTRLKVTVDNDYIQNCLEYIQENITSPISLPQLAKQLNLSPSYLSSLFKQKVGRSISEYIRLVRLEKVKELIGEGKYTIAQISRIMGYCSPTYLSTEFKREFDMTPKEYAKMLE